MKKLISIGLAFIIAFSCVTYVNVSAEEEFTKSGMDFVSDIRAGWNLGNTFETGNKSWTPGSVSINTQETSSGTPTITKNMIDFVKASGFNAIRIPFTWYYGMKYNSSDNSYTLRTDYADRIKQIVKYAYDNDMYVIVNMHHDDQLWLDVSGSEVEFDNVKTQYRKYWEIIADLFKDYDEKLILEAANEITATYSYDNCNTASGKCWWGHSQKVFDRQNDLYKIFFDTVRASGGNNDKRYLMVPTYGAQWYANQIDKLYLPENDSRVIMDIHWYSSATSASSVSSYFSYMQKFCTENNNIGCVFGECGLTAAASQTDNAVLWANAYVATAKTYGIPCFLWDDYGNYQMLKRNMASLSWISDKYVKAVIDASFAFSGKCGDNLKYSYNNTDGSLKITGNGAMTEYANDVSVPWNSVASSIKSITIAEGVTSISAYAFSGCATVTQVTIPDAVTVIEKYTFNNCYALKKINLGTGVNIIKAGAFYGCKALESVDLPNTITQIYEDSFRDCTSLDNLEIPRSVVNVDGFSFSGNTSLKTVTVRGTKTSINDYAFYNSPVELIKCYEGSYADYFASGQGIKTEYFKNPVTEINLGEDIVLEIGDTYQINPIVTPSDTDDKISYKSLDTAVATVSDTGVVTATAQGTTEITVTASSGVSNSVGVTVNKPIVKPATVKFENSNYTLNRNETLSLEYTIDPNNTTETISFTSSSPTVAEVNENGVVRALSPGFTVITAFLSGGAVDTCTVNVNEVSAETISFASENITVYKNETSTLLYNITPSDTAEKPTFTSSDKSVVTVDENGKIFAKDEGEAEITATLKNGYSDKITVTVELAFISMRFSETNCVVELGEEYELDLIINPDGYDCDISFSSSNADVVDIDEDGIITACDYGSAYVYATTENGYKTRCLVTVPTRTDDISFKKSTYYVICGKSITLKPVISPKNTIDTFKWKSSKRKIATVSKNGLVKAKKVGKTIISLKSSNGIRETVTVYSYKLKFKKKPKKLSVGDTFKIKISGAKIKRCKSSKPKIAKVTKKGKIKARKKGTFYLTVTDKHNNKIRCKIKVV